MRFLLSNNGRYNLLCISFSSRVTIAIELSLLMEVLAYPKYKKKRHTLTFPVYLTPISSHSEKTLGNIETCAFFSLFSSSQVWFQKFSQNFRLYHLHLLFDNIPAVLFWQASWLFFCILPILSVGVVHMNTAAIS